MWGCKVRNENGAKNARFLISKSMPKPTPQSLASQLKNIGPKCAQMLLDAGIDTPEKLRKLGAKQAYMKILFSGGFCGNFNAAYLYALEGAILGCDWREIPEKKKLEYKAFTQELRSQKKYSSS